MTQQTNPPAFKVWCNDDKKWLENCVIDSNNKVYQLLSLTDYSSVNEPINEHEYSIHARHIPNPTICRFTGLFDIQSKPIYENDIYKLGSGKYRIVCFIEHSHTSYHGSMAIGTTHTAGFYSRDYYPVHDRRKDIYYGFVGDIEVTGSALENPNMEGLE